MLTESGVVADALSDPIAQQGTVTPIAVTKTNLKNRKVATPQASNAYCGRMPLAVERFDPCSTSGQLTQPRRWSRSLRGPVLLIGGGGGGGGEETAELPY